MIYTYIIQFYDNKWHVHKINDFKFKWNIEKMKQCNPLFLKGTVGLMTTSVNQKKKRSNIGQINHQGQHLRVYY